MSAINYHLRVPVLVQPERLTDVSPFTSIAIQLNPYLLNEDLGEVNGNVIYPDVRRMRMLTDGAIPPTFSPNPTGAVVESPTVPSDPQFFALERRIVAGTPVPDGTDPALLTPTNIPLRIESEFTNVNQGLPTFILRAFQLPTSGVATPSLSRDVFFEYYIRLELVIPGLLYTIPPRRGVGVAFPATLNSSS